MPSERTIREIEYILLGGEVLNTYVGYKTAKNRSKSRALVSCKVNTSACAWTCVAGSVGG